jgi:hypothetical protein
MSDRNQHPTTTIVALARRRIDAPGVEEPRFPLKNVDDVRRRIADAVQAIRIAANTRQSHAIMTVISVIA